MSEQEGFTHDFIDVRYVKDLYHVLQRVGYLGKNLNEVGMPPDDSPYLGVVRDTKKLLRESGGTIPDKQLIEEIGLAIAIHRRSRR